jgi:hypothetical protein
MDSFMAMPLGSMGQAKFRVVPTANWYADVRPAASMLARDQGGRALSRCILLFKQHIFSIVRYSAE